MATGEQLGWHQMSEIVYSKEGINAEGKRGLSPNSKPEKGAGVRVRRMRVVACHSSNEGIQIGE